MQILGQPPVTFGRSRCLREVTTVMDQNSLFSRLHLAVKPRKFKFILVISGTTFLISLAVRYARALWNKGPTARKGDPPHTVAALCKKADRPHGKGTPPIQ